jgi:nucleoside 2-deoxyribosyltransferase
MKTFLICKIRGVEDQTRVAAIVTALEADGFEVHWPYRDTDQECETGLRICRDNVEAIRSADVVHIDYHSDSTGSHFDLGAAFALGKKIISVTPLEKTDGKSFPNMIRAWSER